MYCNYYNLSRKPFALNPDSRVVFGSKDHQEALATLKYGIIDQKGFLLLTGDVGTGKTTLLHLLAKSLKAKIHLCMVSNPTLTVNDFYFYLAETYGLGQFEGNKAKFILEFSRFLRDCKEKREQVLLVIDEAHVLPLKLMEEIRLLSNQLAEESGVMSVFLVGQPELNERLSHAHLLPLRQRIGIRFHLRPFSLKDTKKYIAFRLYKAGATQPNIFTEDAIELIHTETQGVPRLINIVCDQALLLGYADNRPSIDAALIRQSIHDLHIPGESSSLPLAEKKTRLLIVMSAIRKPTFYLLYLFLFSLIVLLLSNLYLVYAPAEWPLYGETKKLQIQLVNKGEILWEKYLRP